MDNQLEVLLKVGSLMELLEKSKEIVQSNGIVGGHRGYVDSMLNDIINEVDNEMERLKGELFNQLVKDE